jgi:hypothetical protein
MARRSAIGAAGLALAIVCAACTACTAGRSPRGPASAGDAGPRVITVGSFDFPESVLLARPYAGALSARGYPVRVLPDLGSRELVEPAGAERFERPLSLQPRFTLTRMYTFDGGCVTYQFSFVPGAAPLLAIPVDNAVAFEPRADLVRHVRRTEGLALCGRGAAC